MHAADLTQILREHPFLAGLPERHVALLVGCASNVLFTDGSHVTEEGKVADKFYLIRSGHIALEIDVIGHGKIRIQTVGKGDVLGWSWLISPFRAHFTGVALSDVHAFALDGACLRKKCEEDHDFGYELLWRLAQVMERRLDATRMQLLDLFAVEPEVHT